MQTSYVHSLHRHFPPLRKAKWKVSMAWPSASIYMPPSQDPKSYCHNPVLAQRQYVSREEQEVIRHKAILFFFLLPHINKPQPLSKWRGGTWYIIIWKECRSIGSCLGNPLRPKGSVIYWVSSERLSQHLLAVRSIGMPLFTYDYYWSSSQMTYQ